MNCYFCNKVLKCFKTSSSVEKYNCFDCNSLIISYEKQFPGFIYVYLFYKTYYIYWDYNKQYCALYYKDSYQKIFDFKSFPYINPQNIESKINAILAFL